jgi:outer membrane protein assembly factor BamB
MHSPWCSSLKFILGGILACLEARAEPDWTQFRGPGGTGMAPDATPPLVWSETNHVAWKTAIPGRGRSSPVLLGERLWLTTALEKNVQRVRIRSDDMQKADQVALGAVCLSRTDGRQLWHTTLFEVENPPPTHWLNSWATPTPVVEPGRLYCDFGVFGTAALDSATGQLIWQQKLPVDHQVGPGSSPVAHSNLLVVVRDGTDAQFVAALDKQTGQVAWKTARPPIVAPDGPLKKSFCTPLVITHAGRVQIIIPGAHWIAAYDPATGGEIWRIRHGNGFSIGTGAVFGQGLAFFSTGLFQPQVWAIRVDGQGDVTGSHVVWKSNRQAPDISSPILVGEDLYWVSDSGTITCVAARTGELRWQKSLGRSYLASPVLAGGRLHFFNQEGKTTILKPGPEFERLAENLLPGPLTATPAFAGPCIYWRNDTHLYCLRE